MTYRCIYPFDGVLGSALVSFRPGDIIEEAQAEEMDLANKPDLAEAVDA
jgi:hypothetical protein